MLAAEKQSLRASQLPIHPRVQDDIDRYGPLRTIVEEFVDSAIIEAEGGQLQYFPISSFLRTLGQKAGIDSEVTASRISEWSFALSKDFDKALANLDKSMKVRIFDAIMDLVDAPVTPRGDTIKRLSGNFEGCWRYRIGDYRLLYRADVNSKTVTLLNFLSRSSAYVD